VIDIHKKYINNIEVDENSLKIDSFIKGMPFKNKLYDLSNLDESEIADMFWEHSRNLDKALEWRNKSIDDILRDFTSDEIKELLSQMVDKSVPLWKYNYQGHKLRPELHESFIIGVPDREKNKIKKDGILNDVLDPGQKHEFVSTRSKDRIVLYRMEAAVPVYAVNDMIRYEESYKISKINHHIDETWQRRMKSENFSIYPKSEDDKETIKIWALGFVYNLLKNDNGNYKAYSEDKGDGLDDYWIDLGKYRDDAYKEFKRLSLADDMETAINKKIEEKGMQENKKIISSAKEGTNYRDIVSQNKLSKDQLDDPRNRVVAELLRKEIDFIKKELS
jgi:hypothetical protein